MNADALLYWLTDRGEGSLQQFKTAVRNLGGEEPRKTWYQLASHGFIEVRYRTGARWVICDPTAFIYSADDGLDMALITGARTPEIVRAISAGASEHGCLISILSQSEMPASIRIRGRAGDIVRLAAALKLGTIVNLADYFCGKVEPILGTIRDAPRVKSPPINWAVRSFDFSAMSWLDGVGSRTACEFTSKFGVKQSYLHARPGQYIPMAKSEAVYSAAAIRGIDLASYDGLMNALRIPGRAALPVPYALWATMAAGSEVTFSSGSRYYKMKREAALPLLVYLGQRCPEVWPRT